MCERLLIACETSVYEVIGRKVVCGLVNAFKSKQSGKISDQFRLELFASVGSDRRRNTVLEKIFGNCFTGCVSIGQHTCWD